MKLFRKDDVASNVIVLLLGSGLTALSACSASQGASTMVPASPAIAQHSPAAVVAALKPAHAIIPRDLYIADAGAGTVDVLRNQTYRDVGAITSGINGPKDVFLDKRGNLYVANYSGGNVSEYAPGNLGAPNFVYSSNMVNPLAVTTDAHGNVFEADNNGMINEYFQGSNSLIASCTAPYSVGGIAVDSSGDVFFFEQYTASFGYIYKYPGGLKGCNAFYVNGFIAGGHGIALDQNNNLLIAAGSQVFVCNAPNYYPCPTRIGSGFSNAISVRLNRKNSLAFVADSANGTVTVVNYPGGTNLMVLGTQNGLADPVAAVDWPNGVY